jgi:NitT/TauT family transport system permease protein
VLLNGIMRISQGSLLRIAVVLVLVTALEALCRTGVIGRLTMIPPSEMVLALIAIVLHADWFWTDFTYTVRNLVAAAVASIVLGYALGLVIHAMPRVRRVLEPVLLSYYSVPTFVFYPLLIVVFGIGPLSLIALGTVFAVVAMVMSTLTAIDRIPRGLFKVARITRLTWLQTLIYVKLPAAAPHLFTGVKLAVIYAVIGVIAGEFIVSTAGIGRRIAFAYNDFDNRTMYGMLLLVISLVVALNAVLHSLERRLHRRWVRRT